MAKVDELHETKVAIRLIYLNYFRLYDLLYEISKHLL